MEQEEKIAIQGQKPVAKEPANPLALKKKSFGEKVFDIGVYTGIGWVANAVLSIAITYKMKYKGKSADELIRAETEKDSLSTTALLMSGGFIVLPFMKFFENRKEQIVEKINQRFSPDEANQPEENKRHWEKQSWKSILSGRVVGLVIVFPGVWLCHKPIGIVSNFIAGIIEKRKKNPVAPEAIEKTVSWRIIKMLTIEVGGSALCAGILYVVSKFAAKMDNKHKVGTTHNAFAANEQVSADDTQAASGTAARTASETVMVKEENISSLSSTATEKILGEERATSMQQRVTHARNAPEQAQMQMA